MTGSIAARLDRLPWPALEQDLLDRGYAHVPSVLTAAECRSLVALYPDERRFRNRVDMARHRFGEGDYKYFRRPLPPIVEELRRRAYPRLAAIANRWMAALGDETRYPTDLEAFLERCVRAGQTEPTPLLLHYEAAGYNCLHQDLYGEVAFPLQLTAFLSSPTEYTGGEFLLVENRPRAQSVGHAITTGRGDFVVFPTRFRPAASRNGYYRCAVRHGVSRVRTGRRYTLGIIFHDAR
jgi:uncharacterized protein